MKETDGDGSVTDDGLGSKFVVDGDGKKRKLPGRKLKDKEEKLAKPIAKFISDWGKYAVNDQELQHYTKEERKKHRTENYEFMDSKVIERTVKDKNGRMIPDPLNRLNALQTYIRNIFKDSPFNPYKNIVIKLCSVSSITGNTWIQTDGPGSQYCHIAGRNHGMGSGRVVTGRIKFRISRHNGCTLWQGCWSDKCSREHAYKMGPITDLSVRAMFCPTEVLSAKLKNSKQVDLARQALEAEPTLGIPLPMAPKSSQSKDKKDTAQKQIDRKNKMILKYANDQHIIDASIPQNKIALLKANMDTVVIKKEEGCGSESTPRATNTPNNVKKMKVSGEFNKSDNDLKRSTDGLRSLSGQRSSPQGPTGKPNDIIDVDSLDTHKRGKKPKIKVVIHETKANPVGAHNRFALGVDPSIIVPTFGIRTRSTSQILLRSNVSHNQEAQAQVKQPVGNQPVGKPLYH